MKCRRLTLCFTKFSLLFFNQYKWENNNCFFCKSTMCLSLTQTPHWHWFYLPIKILIPGQRRRQQNFYGFAAGFLLSYSLFLSLSLVSSLFFLRVRSVSRSPTQEWRKHPTMKRDVTHGELHTRVLPVTLGVVKGIWSNMV